ncbi:MAG: DUF167 domain-containing protein [Thermoanaerobaculum sp.]
METADLTAIPENIVQRAQGGCLLRVRVAPKARRLAVMGVVGDALKVALTAPPERGQANAQLEGYLAELLAVPRRVVSVRAGAGSRDKLVFLEGMEPSEVLRRLQTVLR